MPDLEKISFKTVSPGYLAVLIDEEGNIIHPEQFDTELSMEFDEKMQKELDILMQLLSEED